MPSACEVFYITADLPHGKYKTNKWKNLTGWEAEDKLEIDRSIQEMYKVLESKMKDSEVNTKLD